MADTKISALTAVTTPSTSMEFPVNDGGTTKKLTGAQVESFLEGRGMPQVWNMTSDHNLSSTTATEVTQLGTVTLPAGTYVYTYYLLVQSANTANGLLLGVNFTGTAAVRAHFLRYPSTGTTANTGVADDVGAVTGTIHESHAHNAFSTTAPNMGFTGVATINANILAVIEGLMVVTVSGDLELWHASEGGAVSTTVKAGSSLVVIRTA